VRSRRGVSAPSLLGVRWLRLSKKLRRIPEVHVESLDLFDEHQDRAAGRSDRRERKNEVDMMSNCHPSLRAIPSALGTFGVSMKDTVDRLEYNAHPDQDLVRNAYSRKASWRQHQ